MRRNGEEKTMESCECENKATCKYLQDMKNQGDEHRKRTFIVLYIVWILCDLRCATKEERRRNRMGMTAVVLLPP